MNTLRENILNDKAETVCTCKCGGYRVTYKILTDAVVEDLNISCSICGNKPKAGRIINWSPLTHKINVIETLKKLSKK